nr:receptor-like protein 33 [Ziziphus jujuba var. spinosa]
MKSWKAEKDCCSWDGVTCDLKTGEVIGLDLANGWLQGPLHSRSSLFKLRQLQEINLSFNNFSFSQIPFEFGQLSRLTTLNLSFSMFTGNIPSEISFLNNLVSLGLSSFKNYDETSLLYLRKDDFTSIIQNMTNLRELSLHQVNILSSIPESLANLSSLTSLSFDGCGLQGKFPEKIFQLPKLQEIYVSCNYLLTGVLPQFQPSSSLLSLTLNDTNFSGKLPDSIGNLESLRKLSLWNCSFVGPIPSSIWNLSQLRHLDLSMNHLNGHELPSKLGRLRKLTVLALPSAHFGELLLASCKLREFPDFLKDRDQLEQLDLSKNRIEGQIPNWFWGAIGNKKLNILSLSGNKLQGSPTVPPLFISHFDVSGSNLSGGIHPSLLKLTQLDFLDMSYNHFSGNLPNWLGNISGSLEVLNLQWNNFHGDLSQMFTFAGSMQNLKILGVSHNQLQGKLPQSLINCILILRGNKFHGSIWHPDKLLGFKNLQIIDLSSNSFSRSLPSEYFRYWGGMVNVSQSKYLAVRCKHFTHYYSTTLMNKGQQMKFRPTPTVLTSIDLSNKKFDGEIPSSTCNLLPLVVLNLSSNSFTGSIPSCFGNMRELESLDLSKNKPFGSIPGQLASLTFLEYLNLSDNQLTGPIPRGTQLDTFSDSSFLDNPGLCGFQLLKKCEESIDSKENVCEDGFSLKVVGMGYGFGLVVGLIMGHVTLSGRWKWILRKFTEHKSMDEF